jgi:hypothetical protein
MEIVGGAEALKEARASETNYVETYEEHSA